MMKYRAIFLNLMVTMTPALVFGNAASAGDFSDHLLEEMSVVEQALLSSELPGSLPLEEESSEAFYFRRFWFRDRARAGFHVPGLAKLEIIPEIEMLWERDLPKGWTQYRP